MSEHPNAEAFRRLIEAFNKGDMSAAAALIDADVVWHEIGAAEPVHGAAELAKRAMDFPEGPKVTGEIHDVLANDDHVIGLIKATAETNGETFEYRTAEILHMRDGKITERWAFSDDTARIADFFSGAG